MLCHRLLAYGILGPRRQLQGNRMICILYFDLEYMYRFIDIYMYRYIDRYIDIYPTTAPPPPGLGYPRAQRSPERDGIYDCLRMYTPSVRSQLSVYIYIYVYRHIYVYAPVL